MHDDVLSYVLKSYLEVGSLQQTVESDAQIQKEHDMYINYTIAYKQRFGIDFDLLTFFNSTGQVFSFYVTIHCYLFSAIFRQNRKQYTVGDF